VWYSQFHEDKNHIEPLFEKIGVKNFCCLEVGAMDGERFSNTRHFLDQGWRGIMIEADADYYSQLLEKTTQFQYRLHRIHKKIDTEANSLDLILRDCHFPRDPDLVSIDIDGQDYHIWDCMESRPRVVVIEFCGDPNHTDYIPPKNHSHQQYLGQAGRNATAALAEKKGYEIVGETCVNLICVDQNEITATV